MIHKPNYWLYPAIVHGNHENRRWQVIRAPVVLNPQTTMLPTPHYLVPTGDGRSQSAVVAGSNADGGLAMHGGFFSHNHSPSSSNNTLEGTSLGLDLSLKLWRFIYYLLVGRILFYSSICVLFGLFYILVQNRVTLSRVSVTLWWIPCMYVE